VALTLRLVGGLTTDEIARAFLAPEPRNRVFAEPDRPRAEAAAARRDRSGYPCVIGM
jgi:predicted RNA polymerase sigma factor